MVKYKDKSIIDKYMQDITSGAIPACKWTKLAIKRHRDDLEHAEERGFYFDENEAQCCCDFFPDVLKHSKGEWAGQPFHLEPWQKFIIWVLFGWKREVDGFRRFRTAYNEVARKNGKSTFAAGIGLLLFAFDDEEGAEVYTAATKRDQALIIHSEATRMVKKSPALQELIKVSKNNLSCEATSSKYEPLGADTDGMDGLNTHGNIIDELHAHKTRACWDVLDTATGARRQPLMFAITTAGFDQQGICYEQRTYGTSILSGLIDDDTFFAIIYTLDENDDWADEVNWIKSNPNLNVSVKLDDLQRKAKKAKESPPSLNNFLCKHLDVWTAQEVRWLNMDKWDACDGPVEDEVLKQGVYVGIDMASTGDIASYVMGNKDDEGKAHLLPRFFIPKENAHVREKRDRVPYKSWERMGLITLTPGNVIDYKFIRKSFNDDMEKFGLIELAFDPWNCTQFYVDLMDEDGYGEDQLIKFRQGFGSMNEPAKEFERLYQAGLICHGGHPILKWMASNVAIKEDPAGNIKPVKPEGKSPFKVDGIVAAVMAVGRLMLGTEKQPSPYETRGILTV